MEKGHTPTPWKWQLFGKEYYLTSQTKWRPIVLGTLKGKITSLENGILIPFNPEHPDAKFIEKACNNHEQLLVACKDVLIELEKSSVFSGCKDILKTAIKNAEAQ